MDELKSGLPRDRTSLYFIQQILDGAKVSTKRRADSHGKALLETELYLDWLKGINYAVSAVENMLVAKIQGTRKRIAGLGRPAFAVLYTLMDEFISEVGLHHDGGSFRSTSYPLSATPYPLTMTLVEEARDPSTDARSEEVLKEVEELLRKYDGVMLEALKRYKSESAKSKRVAKSVGRKEQSLTRALCWLCEQTGFGSEECDTGDSLLRCTRRAMQDWKHQYAANDDDGISDDDW
ncbi:hypothetical protein BDQ17DRAFT_1278020 [Cyathus striatus]|nr:hypothetical protein BDQ17DRAFT_1278020 [Cyathus striatus]